MAERGKESSRVSAFTEYVEYSPLLRHIGYTARLALRDHAMSLKGFIPISSNPIPSNKRCRCPISSNFFLMQIMVHLLFEYPIKSFDCSLECLVVPRGSLSIL